MPTNTEQHSWITTQWRPMMAIVYMVVIVFDFVLFPIGWTIIQAMLVDGITSLQWNPITLISGGLFHAAMGAVLGVAAWTRGKEKIAKIECSHYEPEEQNFFAEDRSYRGEFTRHDNDKHTRR